MDKIVLVCMLLLVSFSSAATRITVTGDVGAIRYHDASISIATSWKKITWFKLINADNAICQGISIEEGNDTAISMLLAAKMADKQVSVTVDDSVELPAGSGYCKLQYITIN